MKQFITIEDIARFRPVAAEISPDRINPYIIEAQFQDLKPILGEALFHSFKQKFDISGDALYTVYQELLKGKVYTYQGIEYEFEGIIPCLAYFSLARFAQHNPVHFTSTGTVVKNNEGYSTPVDAATMKVIVGDLRSAAIGYQEQIEKFLRENATSYPLYRGVQDSFNSGGVKFFDSDSNYNNQNYYGGSQR
jgi:hypothetical protein